MNEVTSLLQSAAGGDPLASEQLLPLVYDELRKLAAVRLAQEQPGQTLQPTALVHEAYLRLVGRSDSSPAGEPPHWNSRGHFFGAAAEAMRRILVDQARRRREVKHGGDWQRVAIDVVEPVSAGRPDDLLALDESLARLEAHDPLAAAVVKLRYFAGLSMPEAAESLGVSLRTAERNWTYARTWLHRDLG